jgi:tetratricopeptide (TPR) repeat protein
MFGLIRVVGWNAVQPGAPPVPGGGAPAGAASPSAQGTTDISQMSPREAADRLFNRVMESASAGDSVSAQGFMPMALQAYQMAQPLDMDGLFHVALLQITAGQLDAALSTALQMLETETNHILALGAAAAAAAELGDAAQARAYHQQVLDSYDSEAGRSLPEYEGHTNYLESARSDSQAFLAGG